MKIWDFVKLIFIVVVVLIIAGLVGVLGYLVANNGWKIGVGLKYEISGDSNRREVSFALTDQQRQVIKQGKYSLLLSGEGQGVDGAYSINKLVSTSAFGITWKFVSGFVSDISRPESEKYPRIDMTYFKVDFLDKNGGKHSYWAQLNGLGGSKIFSIAIAKDLFSDANSLIASASAAYPVAQILPKK